MIFLKLGGSLITQKEKTFSARTEIIKRIGEEIFLAKKENPDLELIIGHGSGSFGHRVAKEFGTREAVINDYQWQGFQKVWYAAHLLNRIVIHEFHKIGLPVMSFSPSSSISTSNRIITDWNIHPITSALKRRMIPVIYGDVVFDDFYGGIILSTEDLFLHLSALMRPKKILIAGKEEGVWMDYNQKNQIIKVITPNNFDQFKNNISQSKNTDVTGGMQEKVKLMLSIINQNPEIQIEIFSGEKKENIYKSVSGKTLGTRIQSSNAASQL